MVRTSLSKETISAEKTVEAYKQLSVVERAFRCLKTVDLKIRPVYHYLEDRVRAHVFLCMLAYYVEWHMRQLLAPILFDDHDKEAVRKLPRSVVAPAPRSHAAVQKERTKHTDDGMPVHSFQTLLQDLATVVKDWCQPKIVGAPIFNKITRLTPVQKKTFQLLGIRMKRTQ